MTELQRAAAKRGERTAEVGKPRRNGERPVLGRRRREAARKETPHLRMSGKMEDTYIPTILDWRLSAHCLGYSCLKPFGEAIVDVFHAASFEVQEEATLEAAIVKHERAVCQPHRGAEPAK